MYLNTIPAYVYKIRHIPTGQYYFGFRKATLLAKWGTVNTREIGKLKRLQKYSPLG
jgi:hypothetical protein